MKFVSAVRLFGAEGFENCPKERSVYVHMAAHYHKH